MILVIETATNICAVSLFLDAAQVDVREADVGRGHAEQLLPMVSDLLGDRRPHAISVDCGPGSFTGVRVGLAAAKALALAWQVPVTGFQSLALIAAGSSAASGTVAIPGGHGELFVARFSGTPRRLTSDIMSLPPDEAAAIMSDEQVIGRGAPALVGVRGHGVAVPADPAIADWARLHPADRDRPARPVYGRLPDARPLAAA